ncbi:3519_t:CDS:2 [Entrophospora sp. SA101]|nr:3519_t:CDS:2 [Entrophospora sp. SA101]
MGPESNDEPRKVCDYHATVPQGYHAEALDKPQLGPINLNDNYGFKDCVSAYHAREDVLKAGQKPAHLERINKIRRYANIANFDEIDPLWGNLNDRNNMNDIPEGLKTHYKNIFPGVKEQATNYSSKRREKFCYAQIFQKYVNLFTLDLEAKETSTEEKC